MQGLHSNSAHLWAPREGRGEVANSDFVPFVGDPSKPPPENAGVM